MAVDPPKKKRRIEATQPTEDLPTLYANHVQIDATNHDFRFRFGQVQDVTDDGGLRVAERLAVYMSHSHAKALLIALQGVLERLEKQELFVEDSAKQPDRK